MQDTQWSIKVVEKLTRRTVVCEYQGNRVAAADSDLLRDALTLRTLLLADLTSGPSARVVSQWLRTVKGIKLLDVEHYANDWSVLKSSLLEEQPSLLYCKDGDQIRAFKRRVGARIHYKWILNATCDLMMEELSNSSGVIQWIVFDEKLNFPSLDLQTRMFEDYLDAERDMRQWTYELPEDFVDMCREVAARFEIQLYPFRGKHGPGATAEVGRREATKRRKNEYLGLDENLREYYRTRYVSCDPEDFTMTKFSSYVPERIAELVCVPKSMVKNRTISKEPTSYQYAQQDAFQAMDDWFSHDRWLREHVALHDQNKSASMALRASQCGDYATIDLSAASDSVTRTLISTLFGGSMLEEVILRTRSTHCRVGSKIVELEKVAGMGNAICFPTECLVFSCCCEYAVRRTHCAGPRAFRVFGDDIIIDSRAVPELLKILSLCHFKVNQGKSYWTTRAPIFREACGMWALDGVDVTPLRLSRRLVAPSRMECAPPPHVLGVVALANETFRQGLMNTNRGVHAFLRKHPHYYRIARVSYVRERDNSAAMPMPYLITWPGNDTQWRVNERWNRGLQRTEYRCAVVRAKARCSPGDENDLFSWWCSVCQVSDSGTIVPAEDNLFRDRHFQTAGTADLQWSVKWVCLD